MAAQKGQDVLLFVNTGTVSSPFYEAVAGQRSADISRTASTIDASSKDSPQRVSLAGQLESTVSMEALYDSSDPAYQKLLSAYNSQTTALIQKQDQGEFTEQATVIITDLSESHPNADVSTVSIELEVVGEWSPV